MQLWLKRALSFGSMLCGTTLVFGTVVLMNAYEEPPKEPPKTAEVDFKVEKRPPPKQKRPKPKPKAQRQRSTASAPTPSPNLSSAISAPGLVLPGFDMGDLGENLSEKLLGDTDKKMSVMAGAGCDEKPPGALWLKSDFILNYFGRNQIEAGKKYKKFVEELLKMEYESPLKSAIASTLLGTPGFVAEISERHVAGKWADRSVPAVKELSGRLSLDEILETVNKTLIGQEKLAKKVSIYLCHKYSGAKLKEIGLKFGVGDAAISQASNRLRLQANKDQRVRQAIQQMDKLLRFVKC
jgi:hypothetical protein